MRNPGCGTRPDTAGGAADPEPPARRRTFRPRPFARGVPRFPTPSAQTWERLWPELGISVGSSRAPARPSRWTPARGSAAGRRWCSRSVAAAARRRWRWRKDEPDIDVIAVEIYRRGLAQLLSAIDREQVGNIRLIRGNAIDVLQHLIAPGSLTGVRVFFPDPWPKARHHKRRFLQPATVDLIADRLLPGGVLHAATDHPGYAEHIAEVGDGRIPARPRRTRHRIATDLGRSPHH